MDLISTGRIQDLFDVSSQTVRNWSSGFKQFLSDGANPDEKGAKRLYTLDDLAIFALIADKTQKGETYDQIQIRIEKGERGEVPSLEISEDEKLASEMSPREFALAQNVIKERDMALGRLDELREANEKAIEKIDALNKQVGRLEYKIELLEEQKNKDGDTN